MAGPQKAGGLALTVVQLTRWVCADYLWTCLHERKKYISTFFFFLVHMAELDSDTGLASTEEDQWKVNLSAGRRVWGTSPPSLTPSLSSDRGRGQGVTSGLFTTHW